MTPDLTPDPVPLQVFGLMSVSWSWRGTLCPDIAHYSELMQLGVRLATWNQILDPWVYILLRRSILRRIYRLTKHHASFRSSRWEASSFVSSEKSTANRI